MQCLYVFFPTIRTTEPSGLFEARGPNSSALAEGGGPVPTTNQRKGGKIGLVSGGQTRNVFPSTQGFCPHAGFRSNSGKGVR